MKEKTVRRLKRVANRNRRFDALGLPRRMKSLEEHVGRFHQESSDRITGLSERVAVLEARIAYLEMLPTPSSGPGPAAYTGSGRPGTDSAAPANGAEI